METKSNDFGPIYTLISNNLRKDVSDKNLI